MDETLLKTLQAKIKDGTITPEEKVSFLSVLNNELESLNKNIEDLNKLL